MRLAGTVGLLCLSVALALVMATGWAWAGEAPIQIITVRTGGTRIGVAVPDFACVPGKEALAKEMAGVVSYDLDFTGLFAVLPQSGYPAGFTGFTADPSQIDFAAWRSSKIEFLVHAFIGVEGDRLVAECRLFELLTGSQIVGKKLETDVKHARLAAHQFSDEIVLRLTGVAGIASSTICFSGGETGHKELYVADYDGANIVQVTNHKSISILPHFSPDAGRIAYCSFKDRYQFLYILELATGTSRPLSREVGMNMGPSWAPDGKSLAIALSKDANQEIYTIGADGTNKRRITNNSYLDASPRISPSGNEIAFVSDRGGTAQIWVMGADGGNAHRLSMQGGRSTDPNWSPDGKMMAYVVEQGGFNIWVMNTDGSGGARQLTSAGANESPSWSPDSRHIMFSTNRDGGRLYTVNVETGVERPVALLKMRCEGPDWGPRRQ